ncbi:MAG: PTS sugar transporter subunit IIC [Mycoplasmatales bacterium]
MEKIMNFLEKVLTPIGSKIGGNKYMLALRDGFVYTLPFTLTGSIFLLIAFFPVPAVSKFMEESGWQANLTLVSDVTFGLIAIMVVLGISYHLAKSNGNDAFIVSVLSLLVFLLLQATKIVTESGELVGGGIPRQYLGSTGVFTAMIIAILVPLMFRFIIAKRLVIRMPEQVPPAIAKSFEAVGAVFIILTTFWLFQLALLNFSSFATISEVIYQTIQKPLQGIGNTIPGLTIVLLLMQLLWFFGIHGATLVMGVVSPIYQANSLDNLELFKAGTLSLDNGAHLVTQNLFDSFINNGGSGMTLGIVILLLLPKIFKSKRNNEVAKLAVVPGIFTINEPVIFGIPIVLNPILFIPWLITPLVAAYITIAAIKFGFMPPMNGISLPWTTPPIISGFLISGVAGSIVQIVNICVTAIIWFPFFKVIDKQNLREEAGEL